MDVQAELCSGGVLSVNNHKHLQNIQNMHIIDILLYAGYCSEQKFSLYMGNEVQCTQENGIRGSMHAFHVSALILVSQFSCMSCLETWADKWIFPLWPLDRGSESSGADPRPFLRCKVISFPVCNSIRVLIYFQTHLHGEKSLES